VYSVAFRISGALKMEFASIDSSLGPERRRLHEVS
jgi:hypothetical protein